MTCVVAIWNGRRVFMGADSAATDSHSMDRWTLGFPKVIRKGDFLYGLAGDPTVLQGLRSSFEPTPAEYSGFDYISGPFINSLREFVENNQLNQGPYMPAQLLIGYQGVAYEIMQNYLVVKTQNNYASIGSGSSYALGSLAHSKGSPRKRIEQALKSACEHNAGCAPPFNYVEL